MHKRIWPQLAMTGVLLATMDGVMAQEPPASAPVAQPSSEDGEALTLLNEYTGRNGIGVSLGFASGIGVSYRRYITDKVALRASTFVFALPESSSAYSVGLQGQIDLRRDPRLVLYALAGVGTTGWKTAEDAGNVTCPAAGIGVELGNFTSPGFTYQIELTFGGLLGPEKNRLLPLPQFGVHYTF